MFFILFEEVVSVKYLSTRSTWGLSVLVVLNWEKSNIYMEPINYNLYVNESKDLKELQSRFLELPREVKSDIRVQEAKDSTKDKFSKKEVKNDKA